jgi:hypothetical protein
MERIEYFEKPKQIKKNVIKEINRAQKYFSFFPLQCVRLSLSLSLSLDFPDNLIHITCMNTYVYIHTYVIIIMFLKD